MAGLMDGLGGARAGAEYGAAGFRPRFSRSGSGGYFNPHEPALGQDGMMGALSAMFPHTGFATSDAMERIKMLLDSRRDAEGQPGGFYGRR